MRISLADGTTRAGAQHQGQKSSSHECCDLSMYSMSSCSRMCSDAGQGRHPSYWIAALQARGGSMGSYD